MRRNWSETRESSGSCVGLCMAILLPFLLNWHSRARILSSHHHIFTIQRENPRVPWAGSFVLGCSIVGHFSSSFKSVRDHLSIRTTLPTAFWIAAIFSMTFLARPWIVAIAQPHESWLQRHIETSRWTVSVNNTESITIQETEREATTRRVPETRQTT